LAIALPGGDTLLKELLNEFTDHQNQYPDFDPDTMVVQNYRLKPGLYLRLNKDGTMDEFYVTKKMVWPENNPLFEWFKQADFASSLIEMNKPVDPKKKIHSNNIFTLFCKHEVFGAGGVRPDLKEHIDRYFNTLLAARDKESTEILKNAGYEPLQSETVEKCKARFLSALEAVAERIIQQNIKDNCYIKIFLDANLNDYIYESGRYLLPKIFNSNSYNIEINDQVLGLSNVNMGMNAKKPYLEHKTTAFKVPYRITAGEGVLLRKLFLWLNGQEREGKPLYTGYFPIGQHDPGLFVAAGEMKVRKPAAYVHLDRGMDLTVDDYDFLPSFKDRMDRPVLFENYLDAPKYPGGTLNTLSAVEAHINIYLYGGQLVRNYYVEKIQMTDNLPQLLAVQIMLTREALHSWLRKGNEFPIQNCVDKATMGVLLARLQNLEYITTLAYALNVRLALLNYFSEGENDVGYAIEKAYIALKDKVINTDSRKEHIACQSALEFYLAAGQLLYYYFSRSQAQKLHYDVLWRGIASAKSVEDIKKEHRKHFQKYAYDIDIDNFRFNHMLSIVSSYEPEQEEPINLDALFYGFAASSIIYYTDKAKDSKGNKEKTLD
jgi:CRISPR-associated protein Csh1